MRRIVWIVPIVIGAAFFTLRTCAQEEGGGLVAEDVELAAERDVFGQVVRLVEGRLINQDTVAYDGISIFADVYDADGEIVGEGFGFPVNACGTGLLPDFALQPQESQPFRLELELFEDGVDIDRVDVFPEGVATDPAPLNLSGVFAGIQGVSSDEVVNVEWADDNRLRFAVGCDDDIFTLQEWHILDVATGTTAQVDHPNASDITPALLQQTGLEDQLLFNHSRLTFSPTARRIIYQSPINVMLTAEPDGSFKRLIYEDLSRFTLQGFIWMPQGRFLAYYFGAHGDLVHYYTASVEGQHISAAIDNTMPSITVPGPTPDGAQAVITTTIDDVTGYFLKSTAFPPVELLFEGDPPGNNYPAPIYMTGAGGESFIYIVRPVDAQPTLQCFDMQTRGLNTLTVLPIQLTTEDRAWTFLSPDGGTIALAANGLNGGLWLIDLDEFGGCGLPLAG
jgi:hypothetical protein